MVKGRLAHTGRDDKTDCRRYSNLNYYRDISRGVGLYFYEHNGQNFDRKIENQNTWTIKKNQ